MEGWNLGQLVDSVGNENAYAASAKAELLRRQTLAEEDAFDAERRAAEAQETAARAAVETAEYTKASARYMRWSVYVLTASSVVSALFSAWDHFMR